MRSVLAGISSAAKMKVRYFTFDLLDFLGCLVAHHLRWAVLVMVRCDPLMIELL